MRFVLPLAGLLLILSCGGPHADEVDDFYTRPVALPGGQVIKAEAMSDTVDIMRGLMFRKSLAPDHGMLFLYKSPDHYTHWMYQTLIPLDMIWMDAQHGVVEIVDSAQPCKTKASECASYGGHQVAQYVLEIGAGLAKKYRLRTGDTIQW
jgi:uncharacterized membrane protein (UPF0127 family)